MPNHLFCDSLEQLDPELSELIGLETERQERKLIMVPSESLSPLAVHEAVGSAFSHIYAEGYPDERTRKLSQRSILNYEYELGHYRRYADPRYYKGVEYADVLESLARRRVAEIFSTPAMAASKLYVNVQALSGAPANTAVEYTLMKPGDTLMSMALHVGGHLSHGSKVAWSGKTFNVVHYSVDEKTERLDYDAIRAQAKETHPKVIIGGYTSYPWAPDWEAFRSIADEVGAYLLADIAHVAGLVVAGAYPNPVGIADAVTFTTHKTLNGPRGAVIITHDAKLGRAFDRAVFPGFQGGPHMENIAGIAAAAKIAMTAEFKAQQHQTVANAVALAAALEAEGVRVAYGGTDTHMVLIDCKTAVGPYGTPLMGDPFARILDIAGVVANRNTIPGDSTALYPSGVRLGTPWITERGLDEADMGELAGLIATLLKATQPYVNIKRKPKYDYRARVDFDTLEEVKLGIAKLAEKAATCESTSRTGYPHFYFINDKPKGRGPYERLELAGKKVKQFVDWLTPSNTTCMADGESRPVTLLEVNGDVMSVALATRVKATTYWLDVPTDKAPRVMTWLRALVDGYVATDDAFGRLTFLDAVRDLGEAPAPAVALDGEPKPYTKPYFVGSWSSREADLSALPKFEWVEDEHAPMRETRLHAKHKALGARMVPFGGWDMPVWYTSNLEEHRAVRESAGVFDVSHMGCWDVKGAEAAAFLDLIMANDVHTLRVGSSQYTALFDVDGVPLDDLLVYRMAEDHYLVVVNASNNDKDWAWANAVLKGEVCIDPNRPWVTWEAPDAVVLRDLRQPSAGIDMRAELALQGPKSRDMLLSLGGDASDLAAVSKLRWAGITRVTLGGFDIIISRTGYTGERVAYELFVRPDRLVEFWDALTAAGAVPCGLAARDSLRTEAGLPLYGHEMAGPLNLTMGDAGFGTYPKLYKPFFVGREAYINRESKRKSILIRFRAQEKGQPMPHLGDPVIDNKGKVIGKVTSCAVDREGMLMGLAYVKEGYRWIKTELGIITKPRRTPKGHDALKVGDRIAQPVRVQVVYRFPK